MANWTDITRGLPEKSGSYLLTIRNFGCGLTPDGVEENWDFRYVETYAIYNDSDRSWEIKGFYDDEIHTITNGRMVCDDQESGEWAYTLQLLAWAPFPECYNPQTNDSVF